MYYLPQGSRQYAPHDMLPLPRSEHTPHLSAATWVTSTASVDRRELDVTALSLANASSCSLTWCGQLVSQ